LLDQEAYVTMNVLKNFITSITDTLLQQVSKQVKKAMERVSFTLSFHAFRYTPAIGLEHLMD